MCGSLLTPFALLGAQQVQGEQKDLLSLYQHFHADPELPFQEVNTSARVAL